MGPLHLQGPVPRDLMSHAPFLLSSTLGFLPFLPYTLHASASGPLLCQESLPPGICISLSLTSCTFCAYVTFSVRSSWLPYLNLHPSPGALPPPSCPIFFTALHKVVSQGEFNLGCTLKTSGYWGLKVSISILLCKYYYYFQETATLISCLSKFTYLIRVGTEILELASKALACDHYIVGKWGIVCPHDGLTFM